MDMMESYRLAQDGFDTVLAAVRLDQWDARSACAEWTVRDVARRCSCSDSCSYGNATAVNTQT